ncbi:hypothetical protein JTB14_034019 [Gonioctena quinquepunctata]|nr:hypothetical protein JTB14_034019 [Gonioctena quinquepunctata]
MIVHGRRPLTTEERTNERLSNFDIEEIQGAESFDIALLPLDVDDDTNIDDIADDGLIIEGDNKGNHDPAIDYSPIVRPQGVVPRKTGNVQHDVRFDKIDYRPMRNVIQRRCALCHKCVTQKCFKCNVSLFSHLISI